MMTPQTIDIIEKWQESESMVINRGAVYLPGENPFSTVGIDGEIDLGAIAEQIQNAERERCAKIAESIGEDQSTWTGDASDVVSRSIADKIRSGK